MTVLAAAAFLALGVGSASAATIYKQVGEISGSFVQLKSGSVAVNATSGAVYVADSSNGTVSEFESATDTSAEVFTGAPIGSGFVAVAVDDTSGAVYVADSAAKEIKEFSAAGAPIRTLDGSTTPAGSFEPPPSEGSFGIAVDQATGDLYAIDAGHEAIDVFSSSGVYLEAPSKALTEEGIPSAKAAGLFAFGTEYTDGIAVDDFSGQLLLTDSGPVKGFRFSLASGEYLGAIEELGVGYTTIAADNASGAFYGSAESSALIKRFKASGVPDGSAIEGVRSRGLAVDQADGDIYAASTSGTIPIFEALGVPDVTTLPPSAAGQTSAVLHGHVDPAENGPITDCHFVISGGIGNVPCDQPTPINAAEEVTATATGLSPNTDYTYRLVAANAKGANEGAGVPLRTTGPPLIESLSASDVSAGAATLEATINPENFATSYHFDYITEAAWLADGEAFGAGTSSKPVPDQPIGAGNVGIALTARLTGLAPATPYRYRVLTSSTQGNASTEHALTTQTAPNPLLPDGRGYELVSPVDKRGSLISPIHDEGVIEAAQGGQAFTYLANAATEAEAQGNAQSAQLLSRRTASGWASQDIALPHQTATGAPTGGGLDYRFFSLNLANALVEPRGSFPTPGSVFSLSPQASEQTSYVRTNLNEGNPESPCQPTAEACYRPLVTGAPGVANVPPGTVFGEASGFRSPQFLGASDELSHAVLISHVALTATPLTGGAGLYEWSAAAPPSEQLKLVSVLPGPGEIAANGHVSLGSGRDVGRSARGAIGPGGQRVFWESSEAAQNAHLYVRDLALGQTVQLDTVQGGSGEGSEAPRFQIANATADRVFFTDSQRLAPDSGGSQGGGKNAEDLYECHLVETGGELTCELTDLTPLGPGGEEAEVIGVPLGISEDGSDVYFVANGALAEGAVHGDCPNGGGLANQSCNLYRYDATTGQTRLVAVLSGADYPDWGEQSGGELAILTARVSPNGRYLAFQSQRPLTGYDNRDAVSGERDEEVFLYDDQTGSLACASCNPSGARPEGAKGGFKRGNSVWGGGAWVAATIPGWTPYQVGNSLYQSRYLSNSGRLFFNSYDALAPEDSNGTADVYEYEPAGVGTCSSAAHGYVTASNGCVDLISSGTSPEESGFLDASESGDDVFFLTSSALTGKDKDQIGDVYDARVGGGEGSVAQPVQCEGDGCQQPAVPPVDATPGSLSFHGAGNVLECRKGKVRKSGKCVAKVRHDRNKGKKHKHRAKKHQQKGTVNR